MTSITTTLTGTGAGGGGGGGVGVTTLCALMFALAPDAGGAPEWVQLLPAGTFKGRDGRGPYHVGNARALIAASMAAGLGKLPLDENHSTQRAAPEGRGAPALGWIVELAERDDGIWGRLQWTPDGRKLVADGAYRGISPVFTHTAAGTITLLVSAALTNTPNLTLATLHDTLDAAARDRLDADDFAVPGKRALPMPDARHVRLAWDMVDRTEGLSDAERAEARSRILARAKALGVDTGGWQAAHSNTQNQSGENEVDLTALRAALGADPTLDDAGVIAAAAQAVTATAEHARATETTVTALQTQVTELTAQVAAMSADARKTRAETFIDGALRAGKPIVPVRERLIAQHMVDPEGTEALVNGMPSVNAGGAAVTTAVMDAEDGDPLTEEEMATARAMGIDPKEKARAKRLRRLGRGDEIGRKQEKK